MNKEAASLNIVAIVQARMGSTRLPGKTLMEISGRPMLGIQLDRLQRCKLLNKIVVAIPDSREDEPIEALCRSVDTPCFRGDGDDVLKRYYDAAVAYKADVIVRLTADCPLIDPEIVDQVISFYLDNYPKYDYVSNVSPRTFPRGMDVEVFSFETLEKIAKVASAPSDREHVTLYLTKHPNAFKQGKVMRGTNASIHRLTVDAQEDFEVVSKIFKALYPENSRFGLQEMLTYLEEHPEIEAINAHITQKPIENEQQS